jgi:hypothetical protein
MATVPHQPTSRERTLAVLLMLLAWAYSWSGGAPRWSPDGAIPPPVEMGQ